jgi:8-oxo-dGTP diphosphatase
MKLATLVYVRREGETLMMHRGRKPGDVHAGKWNGLGGKFDPGESPEQCAIREVAEESGLQVRNPRLRGVLTFPAFKDGEDWYVFVFVATEFAGQAWTESAEGALEWVSNKRLAELPMWEGDRVFLPLLDQPTFFSGRFSYRDGQLQSHEIHRHEVEPVGV